MSTDYNFNEHSGILNFKVAARNIYGIGEFSDDLKLGYLSPNINNP
jgi:hypothetical protein